MRVCIEDHIVTDVVLVVANKLLDLTGTTHYSSLPHSKGILFSGLTLNLTNSFSHFMS